MRRAAGFTLLEVLVAVVLLGMIILLVDQGLGFGLRATAMQARAHDRESDVFSVDHALRQIVAQADPGIFPEPATLHGTARLMPSHS